MPLLLSLNHETLKQLSPSQTNSLLNKHISCDTQARVPAQRSTAQPTPPNCSAYHSSQRSSSQRSQGRCRELILPLARLLGVPTRNVMANRMQWQVDDDTGLPSKLAGFDPRQAVAHNRGKPAAIRELRRQHPYQNVVMIGDGITDLEAVQVRTPPCNSNVRVAKVLFGYGQ